MDRVLAMLQRGAGQDGQLACLLGAAQGQNSGVLMDGKAVGMAELTKAGTQREEQTPMFALA
jgi:hypothetical protein